MSKKDVFATNEVLIKDNLKRLNDELRIKGVSFDIDGVEIGTALLEFQQDRIILKELLRNGMLF